MQVKTFNYDLNVVGNWHVEIKDYLESFVKKDYFESFVKKVPFKVKAQALNYILLEGKLYRKTFDGLLLRCLIFSVAQKRLLRAESLRVAWMVSKKGHFGGDMR